MNFRTKLLSWTLLLVFVTACALGNSATPSSYPPDQNVTTEHPVSTAGTFKIVATDEFKSIVNTGVLEIFGQRTGIKVDVQYAMEVDIKQSIAGTAAQPLVADAFVTSSLLWQPGFPKVPAQSVVKTLPVLAVVPSKAAELGWNSPTDVTVFDLLGVIQQHQFTYIAPSASQNGLGLTYFIGLATAVCEDTVVQTDCLQNPAKQAVLKDILSGIGKSSGNSAFLVDWYLKQLVAGNVPYDGAVMTERDAINTNLALVAAGKEPLKVFYVEGTLAKMTMPIRLVDTDDQEKIAQYNALIDFLSTDESAYLLSADGWRTNIIGIPFLSADPAVFNPSWGIDTTTDFQLVRYPKDFDTDTALKYFQEILRRSSLTYICADFSGSMDEPGSTVDEFNNPRSKRQELYDAIDILLLHPETANLQATPEDVYVIVGFTEVPWLPIGVAYGSDPDSLKELSTAVRTAGYDGGTNLFGCVEEAIVKIEALNSNLNYSVIALSDGDSRNGPTKAEFSDWYKNGKHYVPVYGIPFGAVVVSDPAQLKDNQMSVFSETGGYVIIDCGNDLGCALRKAKANN